MENTVSQKPPIAETVEPLTKYYFIFAAALLAAILVTLLLAVFGIDLGNASSTIQLMSATAVVALFFVKKHERMPSKKEKRRLYIGSLLTSFTVSGMCIAVFSLLAPGSELARSIHTLSSQLSWATALGTTLFFALIYYFTIILFYSMFFFIAKRI